MYKGTLCSIIDNPFIYNIKFKELPVNLIVPVKDEVYILSDIGKRELEIEIESEDDLMFSKTNSATLNFNIDKIKIKINLKNVLIKKTEKGYTLTFSTIYF